MMDEVCQRIGRMLVDSLDRDPGLAAFVILQEENPLAPETPQNTLLRVVGVCAGSYVQMCKEEGYEGPYRIDVPGAVALREHPQDVLLLKQDDPEAEEGGHLFLVPMRVRKMLAFEPECLENLISHKLSDILCQTRLNMDDFEDMAIQLGAA